MGRVYLYLKTWAGLRHSRHLCPQLVTSRVHLCINFQWKTVRQDQTWLKEESSSLLVLVGMDDGAGVPAEGGPLAGSCHAFYITSTNSGFYITLSLWGWWWWWWGMIMLMLRRRGPLTGPCQAFYIALPTNFTSYPRFWNLDFIINYGRTFWSRSSNNIVITRPSVMEVSP